MKKIIVLILLFFPVLAVAEEKSINPAKELTGNQREYYVKIFNYVMEHVKPPEAFNWNSSVAKGNIKAGEEYLSKSKAQCRDFTETFEISGQLGRSEGTACKRDGNNGWCRISGENPRTCALENPEGITDKIMNDVDSVLGKSSEMMRNAKDWWGR